jgi:hypothetical protein
MVIAKNPGIGRGKGGGRPKRGAVVRIAIGLTPEAASLLDAATEASGRLMWEVVDGLIKQAFEGKPQPQKALPKLPPDVEAIVYEAGQFLTDHADTPKAARTLKRAWNQSLVLARHELGRGKE